MTFFQPTWWKKLPLGWALANRSQDCAMLSSKQAIVTGAEELCSPCRNGETEMECSLKSCSSSECPRTCRMAPFYCGSLLGLPLSQKGFDGDNPSRSMIALPTR